MSKQDYILKKHVRAATAGEAIAMDDKTPVHEVYIVEDKPEKLKDVVGFKQITEGD